MFFGRSARRRTALGLSRETDALFTRPFTLDPPISATRAVAPKTWNPAQ